MPANKIILVSKLGYNPEHDGLLRQLIEDRIELFCVVGKDAEIWEDVMDELFVGNGDERGFDLLTTSHPDEAVEDVVAFAESIVLSQRSEIRVIEL